jgi:nitroimidazol reductase NimA-like FMN-containing flavoprotein (pyridoxamine 5'-phosphate oxidase superfamily)
MTNESKPEEELQRTGPTLYLDRDASDGHFCPFVFESPTKDDYRVVQLTSGQSFDSLQQALDTQLQNLHDPSEAAAVILNPQTTDSEVVTAEVGRGTTMYGFRVNPEDLTGVSIVFSKLLEQWEQKPGSTEVCLRGIESLLPYHETDLLYRFLNTILATLQGAGAAVHMHLNPEMIDEQASELFKSLFTQIATEDTAPAKTVPEDSAGGEVLATDSSDTTATQTDLSMEEAKGTVAMTESEIDSVLTESGLGILAFGGDPPYAIPMSFGYDSSRRELYLQLGLFEGSEKQARIAESSNVSLVVSQYERPDQWRSVIVDGTVSSLSADQLENRDVISVFADSKLASVDVFSMDPGDVAFSWYRLEPSAMSGRKSAGPL